jgi:hypothetical protein
LKKYLKNTYKIMTMKLKQLFVAIFATSVLFVSCSKDDVFEPVEQTSIESSQGQDLRTMSTSPTVSTVSPKAYIFIESRLNRSPIKVINYLKTIPRDPSSTGTRFYSFFTGVGIFNRNFRDLVSYYSMPLWNSDSHLKVIETDIPQVSGGMDSHNNPKLAYNFTTVKIPKGTLNDMGWVTVLIPTSAMNNDTKRQRQIGYYTKNGNRITSSGNNTQTIINTNSTLSSYVINYTGNVIPQGQYRVYSTYGGSGMRVGFNSTNDVYFRGASN